MWTWNVPRSPLGALQGLPGQEQSRHCTDRAGEKEAWDGELWWLWGWAQTPCPSLAQEAMAALVTGVSTVWACLTRSTAAPAGDGEQVVDWQEEAKEGAVCPERDFGQSTKTPKYTWSRPWPAACCSCLYFKLYGC